VAVRRSPDAAVSDTRVLSLVFAEVHDRAAFDSYGMKVAALMASYPGARLVAVAPTSVWLEGDWPGDGAGDRGDEPAPSSVELAIIEWPSLHAQTTFWRSPEYQELKRERVDLASILSYCGEFTMLPGGS
jgi:uncharacterized protein (DUF1330 family)